MEGYEHIVRRNRYRTKENRCIYTRKCCGVYILRYLHVSRVKI